MPPTQNLKFIIQLFKTKDNGKIKLFFTKKEDIYNNNNIIIKHRIAKCKFFIHIHVKDNIIKDT